MTGHCGSRNHDASSVTSVDFEKAGKDLGIGKIETGDSGYELVRFQATALL